MKKNQLQDRPACDKPETEKRVCNFISLQKARMFKGRSTASEQETAKLAQYDGREKNAYGANTSVLEMQHPYCAKFPTAD